MKKVRIGNDIAIEWSIYRLGEGEILQDKKVEVKILDPKMMPVPFSYEIVENKIIGVFEGRIQKCVGAYTLLLLENCGELHMNTLDECNFVQLVPHSYMEGGKDESSITTEKIELSTDIEVPTNGLDGDSAYYIWIKLGHHGTEEDFIAWLQQPAINAANEAQEQMALFAEKEAVRNDAELERVANEETRQANEQERIRVENTRENAEARRKENDRVMREHETERMKAEDQRVLAEQKRNINEDARQSQEATRISNENQRIKNEAKRKSVVRTSKLKTEGLVDTYIIVYSDGSFDTFTVTNGKDGSSGDVYSKSEIDEFLEGKVDTETTVNGKALTGDVTLTGDDIVIGGAVSGKISERVPILNDVNKVKPANATPVVVHFYYTSDGDTPVAGANINGDENQYEIWQYIRGAAGAARLRKVFNEDVSNELIYCDINDNTLWRYSGEEWIQLSSGGGGGDSYTKAEIDEFLGIIDEGKQDTLISGFNIKTINGKSVVGSGDVDVSADFDPTKLNVPVYDGEHEEPISMPLTSATQVISNAVVTMLDSKVDADNLKTINGESILGSGDITIEGGTEEIYIGTGTPPEDAKIAINPDENFLEVTDELGDATDKVMSQKGVTEALQGKQDTLTAGDNITIENNVISAVGGGGDWELLVDNTTTSEIAAWGFTQGDNGQVFNDYKKILLFVIKQPATNFDSLRITWSGTNPWINNNRVQFGANASTATQYCYVILEKTAVGIVNIVGMVSYNNTNSNYQLVNVFNAANNFALNTGGGLRDETIPLLKDFTAFGVGGYRAQIGIGSRLLILGKK